jgi:alpha-galactosidase
MTFEEMDFNPVFKFHKSHIEPSGEVTLDIIDAIITGERADIVSVNMMNNNLVPNLPADMVIEISAYADGDGIHGYPMKQLPEAIAAMIRTHASIHRLIIEAYSEQSRDKLLQAVLLDPTVSTYYNAVSAINELCDLQKEILPPLNWA